MARKYLVTEDEFLSGQIDPADGHLKFTRDNGQVVDMGVALGAAVTDAGIAEQIANPASQTAAQLSATIAEGVESLTLKVQSLTRAEYEALTEFDPTVMYLIEAPAGVWAEVARNHSVNPRAIAPLEPALYWWAGTSNTATMTAGIAAPWADSGTCARFTYNTVGNAGSGWIGVKPVTGEGLFDVSDRWTVVFKVRASASITFAPPQLTGAGTVTMVARSHTTFFPADADETILVWMTVEFTDAPDSSSSLVIGPRTVSPGLSVSYADFDIYPGSFDLERAFFSGATPFEGDGFPLSPVIGDHRHVWDGAADTSESIRQEWQAE